MPTPVPLNAPNSTFANEENLPKLPLPSLEGTLENLLSALKPLISANEYQKLLDQSIDFLNSDKVKLIQQHLLKSHRENDCYLEGEGITTNSPGIYGELRGSTLPRNPFFILEDDPLLKSAPPTQTFRAAVLVTSSLRFISALRHETIPADYTPVSSKPLTMFNYRLLFGTTRVPIDGKSEQIGIGSRKKLNSRTIVVMSKGQFYSLEVLDHEDRPWFTKHELSEILDAVIEDSASLSKLEINKIAIGAITTESKSSWRSSRIRLGQTNGELLQAIDDLLFVLCLDTTEPRTDEEKLLCISHGTNALDENNFQIGSCLNRWYDKLQIVVTKNAVAGIIWESTSTDATSVLRFFTDVYTDSVLRVARKINGTDYTMFQGSKAVAEAVDGQKPQFQKLEFKLPGDINNALHLAETRLADLINQHEYHSVKIAKFGQEFIKNRMNLPSDSVIQMVLQITHYLLYGKLCSTNEPVSTRRFKSSRTELINIQSDLVLKCCQLFITSSTSRERWHHFKDACTEHSARVYKASHGYGFERHLSALRSAYIQREFLNAHNGDLLRIADEVPPLIFNPVVDLIYKTEILVLNCGNPALSMFGVTPAVSYGYGVGYIIKNDYLEIVACSQWRQTERFLTTFNSVVNEVKACWRSECSIDRVGLNNGTSRARELEQTFSGANQHIIQSLPMALVNSNNSSTYNNTSVYKTTEKDKTTILGGYDYFDVETLQVRSNEWTRSNSAVNSRNISSTNLRDLIQLEAELSRTGSPLNPHNRATPKPKALIGKMIDLQDDDL